MKVDFIRKSDVEDYDEVVFRGFAVGKNVGQEFLVTSKARFMNGFVVGEQVCFF